MRLTTILLSILVVIHQMILPKINSILLMEIMIILLFYFVGGPIIKQYMRDKKRERIWRESRCNHNMIKETKSWRKYNSDINIVSSKTDYFDHL